MAANNRSSHLARPGKSVSRPCRAVCTSVARSRDPTLCEEKLPVWRSSHLGLGWLRRRAPTAGGCTDWPDPHRLKIRQKRRLCWRKGRRVGKDLRGGLGHGTIFSFLALSLSFWACLAKGRRGKVKRVLNLALARERNHGHYAHAAMRFKLHAPWVPPLTTFRTCHPPVIIRQSEDWRSCTPTETDCAIVSGYPSVALNGPPERRPSWNLESTPSL